MYRHRFARSLISVIARRSLFKTILPIAVALAATTTLQASGGRPSYLQESVSGVPAAGHTYQPNPGEVIGSDDAALEAAAWWVGDYPPRGVRGPDLRSAEEDGTGLQQILALTATGAAGQEQAHLTAPWTELFTFGDELALKAHWQRTDQGGSEETFVDTADLAYFAGQARPVGLCFLKDGGTGVAVLTPANAQQTYGDGDLDWVGLNASRALWGSRGQDWANAMDGLRLLLGFQTVRADVAHGPHFARYLRLGYTLPQAWFKAVDRLQPEGVAARILAERPEYYNDTQDEHDAPTEVDGIYCTVDHTTSSRPQTAVTSEKLERLPVIPLPVLTVEEADTWLQQLADTFGVAAANPIVDPSINTVFSTDGQLEVDTRTGAYHYVATDDLWLWRTPVPGALTLTPGEVRIVAHGFLQQTDLLPANMQFQEVVADTITCASKGQPAQAAAQTATGVTAYQVIFVRTVEVELAGGQTLQVPVYGPGSTVKVYVRTTTSKGTPIDELIVGVAGVKPASTVRTADAAANQDVTPLDYALVEKMVLDPELASLVALAPVSLDEVKETRVDDHGFAYWQGPMNWRQDELIPVYMLKMASRLNDESTAEYPVYFPAAARYLAPPARVESVDIKDGASQAVGVKAGDTLILEALDARTALKDAGYDASLDIVLGSGGETAYDYNWYVGRAAEANRLGVGWVLEYTVPDLWAASIRTVRLVLEVVDTASYLENRRSTATYAITLVEPEGAGAIYLPSIRRQ